MQKIVYILIFLSLSGCSQDPKKQVDTDFSIDNLKCEYASSPINIDTIYPRFSWIISSDINGEKQTAYQILVSDYEDMSYLLWDTGKVNNNKTNQITYKGKKLESDSEYYWKVFVWDKDGNKFESRTAKFEIALLDRKDWVAEWIGAGPNKEPYLVNGFLKNISEQSLLSDTINHNGRSLLLRREFEVKKIIKSAKVYVTGLGYYELFLNGDKVGDHVLSPAKTNYAKEVLYDTYDITSQLKEGKNAFGIHLGNGWFNPYKKWWNTYRMQWFGAKRAILQLHIEYEDGEKVKIITDKNWKYSPGPVLYNCIYDGEFYDANQEIENWSNINFNDNNWEKVIVMDSPKGELRSQNMQAIKIIQKINPVKVYKPKVNTQVYDMGQNFAGWAKITLKGKKGTKLHLQFAEEIYEDGSINTTSNEHAKAEATYILKGWESETYEPRFTFYGFRYVEISSDSELPIIEKIQGCVVHSDNELTGFFESGNKTINKIHKATVWSQKSNMIGFPSDCPQRDERLGWFGDAQVTAEEAMFNFDMPRFYENWITGIRKNQDTKTGDIPIISPRPYIVDEGVEWSSTYFTMIWQYYIYYGDSLILRKNYDAMKRYMKFLDNNANNYILKQGWIGDWGSLVKGWQEGEPQSIPTAFYYWDAIILAKIAAVLENKSDIDYFSLKAELIKDTYNKKYFNKEKMEYHKGSQMANAFPLYLGLVPEGYKKEVLNNLVKDILIKNKGHLTTGVLGSKYMIDVLTQEGRADVAYLLATQTGYPSWSDMVEKYTTMSEFWTLKQSHNHVMTGSIDSFFYKTLAGFHVDENYPGFKRITIKPFIPNTLNYIKSSIETVKGKVLIEWINDESNLILKVEIPANILADIYVPVNIDAGDKINKKINNNSNIKFIKATKNYRHYLIDSGVYEFKVNH